MTNLRGYYLAMVLLCTVVGFSMSSSRNEANSYGELSLEELLSIEVVTASKKSQKITEAPATIMIVTASQITERGYDYLDEALRDVPGIDQVRVQGAYPTIHVLRGSYGDENKRLLLMIDGIVENSLNGGFEMGGPAYSLHNIERIEIIWGPASALYGANAYSGIINMITKDNARDDGFHYEKGYGSFDKETDKLLYMAHKNHFGIHLSASFYSTDGPVYERPSSGILRCLCGQGPFACGPLHS